MTRTATLSSGGWFLMLIVSILFSVMMGLAIIWLGIDQGDTAFVIQKIQKQTDAARAHVAKLEVERDSLLSPYVLGQTAEQLGMSMADPGQIRRIETARRK